jgi:HD superfamily phosphohydrolase
MTSIRDLPEIAGLDGRGPLVRIPPELDVPLTDRVRALVDTDEFRRLARISQLGLVSLVYPAAIHTRFEHSLGVYRLALLTLRHLSYDERFAATITPDDAELFLVAALLHDLGHWPFCHPIEDMHLSSVPTHELFANSYLLEGEIADTLRDDWEINPRDLVALLSEKPRDARSRILRSLLSGPIDIDKMDYLERDSWHCGVPYGRNFDRDRLVQSLVVNAAGDGLAISAKGKTAAELMVFARYVMFSEVYWHHAVRAATCMFARSFFELRARLALRELFRRRESDLVAELCRVGAKTPAAVLLDGLFGPTRRLHKRVVELSATQQPELYQRLAGRPYVELVELSRRLTAELSGRLGRPFGPTDVLIDAPPVHKEVEFRVDILSTKEGMYRPLAEVSPVVAALARTQFDDAVKRVRVFAAREVAEQLDAASVRQTLAELA